MIAVTDTRITTAEQMNALPIGSVVLSTDPRQSASRAWFKYGRLPEFQFGNERFEWQSTDGGFIRTPGDVQYALIGMQVWTLLFRPDAPAPGIVDDEQVDALAYQVCQKGGHIPNRDRSLPGSCVFHRQMAEGYVETLGLVQR